jgi:hypothetical protein
MLPSRGQRFEGKRLRSLSTPKHYTLEFPHRVGNRYFRCIPPSPRKLRALGGRTLPVPGILEDTTSPRELTLDPHASI